MFCLFHFLLFLGSSIFYYFFTNIYNKPIIKGLIGDNDGCSMG